MSTKGEYKIVMYRVTFMHKDAPGSDFVKDFNDAGKMSRIVGLHIAGGFDVNIKPLYEFIPG